MPHILQPEQGFDLSTLETLFAEHMPRLAHMRDASAVAHDLEASFGLGPEHGALLSRNALLHDIGYAPALRRFGHHPLDGALFLSEHGEHPWVVEGVLRHSQADRKAGMDPAVAGQYAARPPLEGAAWLVGAVTVCDCARGAAGRGCARSWRCLKNRTHGTYVYCCGGRYSSYLS